jgi:carboxyl-terminal processing protease
LQREIVRPTNVSYAGYLGPDSTRRIGYVRLDGFGPRAAREVRRAFRTMLRGGGLNGAVLDLRNNPGGLVSEAVELVGLFVPQGTVVVSIQGRDENRTQRYATEDEPLMPDIPLVVLVNEFSASSSEIVSGAFQDLDRAVIVGETTFGKGLVQVGRTLPYNSSMRMTIGHYYTPRGRDLQSHRIASRSAQIARPSVENYRTTSGRPVRSGVGIEPDVAVHNAAPGELLQALRQEGAFFRFAGEWVRQNPSFKIDNSIFAVFTGWLLEQGFTYTTRAGQALVRARDAVADDWDPTILETIDQAREAIEIHKSQEIQNQRAEITAAVIDEIQSRFLQRDDYIRGQLRVDRMAIKALEISLDNESYRSLLTL